MKLTQAMMGKIYWGKAREDGLLAERFFQLADIVKKGCRPERPCKMYACPRCLRRQTGKSCLAASERVDKAPPGDLKVAVLRVPRAVLGRELNQTFELVGKTVRKLIRGKKSWPCRLSAWVACIRVRHVDCEDNALGRFRFWVRLLVVVHGKLNKSGLKQVWGRLLSAAHLLTKGSGKNIVGLPKVGLNRRREARRVVGDSAKLLAAIAGMKAADASEYLRLLRKSCRLIASSR